MNRPSGLLFLTGQGALAGGLACGSLLMPVEFLHRLRGMLLHWRPVELVSVFGTAWLVYFGLGFLSGGIAAALCAGAVSAIRRSSDTSRGWIVSWIFAFPLVFALISGSVMYFEGDRLDRFHTQAGWSFPATKAVVVLGGSLWLAMRRPMAVEALQDFAKFLAVCGAIALCVTAGIPGEWRTTQSDRLPQQVADDTKRSSAPLSSPPVVLITIDALSAAHMSLYGYHRATTPSLDQAARAFTVFERHYSNSNFTTPAISSLLTGSRP